MSEQQLRLLLDLLEKLVVHAEHHASTTPVAAIGEPIVSTARRALDRFREAAKC